jgi:hypothetical protein
MPKVLCYIPVREFRSVEQYVVIVFIPNGMQKVLYYIPVREFRSVEQYVVIICIPFGMHPFDWNNRIKNDSRYLLGGQCFWR